jgi:hypothetical protein
MRKSLILFIASVLPTFPSFAQSPRDGHVTADFYINSYFHFSYSWPKTLHPVDEASMNVHAPAGSTDEFFLFSAKKPDAPFGVVIIAEKPNFHAPASGGMNDSQSFLEHVKKTWDPAGHPKILSETQSQNGDGLTFYELDYIHFGQYSSAIATQIGEFQIVFRCNAKSVVELSGMTKSVLASHLTK